MQHASIRAIILSGLFALGTEYSTMSLVSSAYRAGTGYVVSKGKWQDKRHSEPGTDIVSYTQIKEASVTPERMGDVHKIRVKKKSYN